MEINDNERRLLIENEQFRDVIAAQAAFIRHMKEEIKTFLDHPSLGL